jgi:carboxymethylenebutenolidase
MCFDPDSHPPIAPIAGGALDAARLTLSAADGNRFSAFRARPVAPTGAGLLVLPDVRGLHPYYEELALRFAEHGVDALAIDYFGRTAGATARDDAFEYMPHVRQTTWSGLTADIRTAADTLREDPRGTIRSLFTIGFCMGGRLSFLAATLGLELTGVIGFYGPPTGPARHDSPAPVTFASAMSASLLGIFGGADASIGPSSIAEFGAALEAAGVDHRLLTYPGAPHSFFDRKATEFAAASDAAWTETLGFIQSRTSPAG